MGPLSGSSNEVIRITDARSMADGYNRGASRAHADWMLFCHDDIAILSEAPLNALREAMRENDMFGVCGTRRLTSPNWYDSGQPYTFGSVVAPLPSSPWRRELQVFGLSPQRIINNVQALDGICIACRRSTFDTLKGFDEEHFPSFMGYDIDFSFRGFRCGARVGIQTSLLLLHLSITSAFSAQKMSDWRQAMQDLSALHGDEFAATGGERGHLTLPIDGFDPSVAATMLESLRHMPPTSFNSNS